MTLQQLRHPNVLQFLGACMKMPNLCMVTEHMPHSLHAVLYTMQGVELDRKRIVGLAIEMARAFVYLHSRKPAIVHRCAGEGLLKAHGYGCGVHWCHDWVFMMIMPAWHAAPYRSALCFADPPPGHPLRVLLCPPAVQHAFPSPCLAPYCQCCSGCIMPRLLILLRC